MSRSCAHRRKPSIVSSGPKWMCWPSVLFSRARPRTSPRMSSGMADTPVAVAPSSALKLRRVAAWRGIRVLAWNGDVLYGCRGYQIVCLRAGKDTEWKMAARFRPVWWRNLTSRVALSSRLMRDGFHALAILDRQTNHQTLVGAVPGALVTRAPGGDELEVTHQIQRGTRPLHVTAVPSGSIYWGEYFDNRERAEVHIYV